ncbi:Reverse transcriptase (RNA-dependent DNA polymerase) (fragment) [Syntrophaceticus schinkii]|uniref:Reverse transcriptase (RNA-dependent DNA polymerase) n=2 Tax=Syntrophaceticus schinkii TaxID=499207 RepID=A0A0B7MH15_9FIRM
MLIAAPYLLGKEAATTIAQISCYNGRLPQGAPTSPVLTNMICAPLDNQLMRFAKRNDMIYTRYADDLSFSPHKQNFTSNVIYVTNEQLTLGDELIDIIKNNSFKINEQKIKLKGKTERQEVTGLVVNKFPNIKREYIRNLRAILHNCTQDGIYHTAQEYINKGFCHNALIFAAKDDPSKEEFITNWFMQVVKGKINYIMQVKGSKSMTFLKYAQQANKIFGQSLFDIASLDELNEMINKNVYILECSEGIQGTGFYIKDIGIITSHHVTKNNGFYKVFTAKSYIRGTSIGILSKGINEVSSDAEIDYAIYNLNVKNASAMKIGDSSKLKIGDKIIVAGFPNFKKGDSVTKQSCEIIGCTSYHGAPFFKISGRIVHGASGGAVFNSDNEVVGIIKGGIASLNEDDKNDMQGFVPIHLMVEDLRSKSLL